MQTHPSRILSKLSERFTTQTSTKTFSAASEFQAILEKTYSFQHLTERLLEVAEGGLGGDTRRGESLV